MTKDERFLLELYHLALAGHESINPQIIAKKLNYKENLTKEILKGLRQANLVKIISKAEILITARGKEVAHSLLS